MTLDELKAALDAKFTPDVKMPPNVHSIVYGNAEPARHLYEDFVDVAAGLIENKTLTGTFQLVQSLNIYEAMDLAGITEETIDGQDPSAIDDAFAERYGISGYLCDPIPGFMNEQVLELRLTTASATATPG